MSEDDTHNVDSDADVERRGAGIQRTDADRFNDVDPLEFVRAILNVSPEDAAKVREQAAGKGTKADRDDPQEGPVHDYGEG